MSNLYKRLYLMRKDLNFMAEDETQNYCKSWKSDDESNMTPFSKQISNTGV